jgi:hypothetical protein
MHGMSLAIKTTERHLLCSPLLLLKNCGLTLVYLVGEIVVEPAARE